jgi:putative glutamine amidotransferase
MLKIGISSCFLYPDRNRSVFGPKTLSYVETDMFRFISKQNILPVLIPPLEEPLLVDILQEMDGFIFQGGSDVSPKSYGEEPMLEGKWPGDSYRDQYELKIMDFAIGHDKPVLAICRGLQLLNVYFGGTLYQDIPTMRPDAILHRDATQYDKIKHAVRFTSQRFLEELYQDVAHPKINSVHHQAIKDLGKDLEVLAVCPDDGIIEAIGFTGAADGKVLGVQWHPEFSATLPGELIDPDKLFHLFLSFVTTPVHENN